MSGAALRVAVVGATGVVGRQTVARLLERGHSVRAMVRPAGRAIGIRHQQLDTVAGDILDSAALELLLAGCDVALHLATAIPPFGPAMDWSANDRVRRDGTASLLAALRATGVSRAVFQSIAMLTGGHGAAWVDEGTPVATNPVTQSAADMEGLIRASDAAWVILRGAMFYGARSGLVAGWQAQAAQGILRIPGDGTDYISLVHVADMARAVVAAAEGSAARCIANVADDHPMSFACAVRIVADAAGQADVLPGGPATFKGFRVSNAAMKRLFAWQPLYPSLLSGLATG